MFYKLVSIISQQDLDSEVDVELLKKAGLLITDNECDTYFISVVGASVGIGGCSVCCHGLSNHNSVDTHVKLLTWRLFGLLVYLYYGSCYYKYKLINNLVNIPNIPKMETNHPISPLGNSHHNNILNI